MRLFKKGYLKEEELQGIKMVFEGMLIEIIDVFDPENIVVDVIKEETGMGFNKYLQDKSNDFVERLGEC